MVSKTKKKAPTKSIKDFHKRRWRRKSPIKNVVTASSAVISSIHRHISKLLSKLGLTRLSSNRKRNSYKILKKTTNHFHFPVESLKLKNDFPRSGRNPSPLHNKFTGQIPKLISEASQLEKVQLNNNLFDGEIPSGLRLVKSLYRFSTSLNHFYGEIPPDFCDSPVMSIMNLSRNSLSGHIPQMQKVALDRIVGEAAFQSIWDSEATSSCYIAPEYGYIKKASEQLDVYSFGVVLLELICGRQAVKTDSSDDSSLDIVKWVRRKGTIHEYNFNSGSDEGVYAWVVANYAFGTLGGDPSETTVIIELGGASAQVTFVSREATLPFFSHNVKFGNITYNLYSHNLLHFGLNVAHVSWREALISGDLNLGN